MVSITATPLALSLAPSTCLQKISRWTSEQARGQHQEGGPEAPDQPRVPHQARPGGVQVGHQHQATAGQLTGRQPSYDVVALRLGDDRRHQLQCGGVLTDEADEGDPGEQQREGRAAQGVGHKPNQGQDIDRDVHLAEGVRGAKGLVLHEVSEVLQLLRDVGGGPSLALAGGGARSYALGKLTDVVQGIDHAPGLSATQRLAGQVAAATRSGGPVRARVQRNSGYT
jgi:hypothetical protein